MKARRAAAALRAAWRRHAWAPLALALAWLAATLGVRPLAVPDEGRYAGVAWAMATGGDWLVPRLDGLPYFHKPPLFYWITAAALRLAGPHDWVARVAPLFGGALAATALFLFARRWLGARAARLALLALATQPLFFLGSQYANLDMLVAGCITATVLAFAHAALCEPQGGRARPALAAGWLFAALGLLAKGLIGIVLPGLVLTAWLLLQGRPRTLLRLAWWPGLLLFLAVAAPWFLAMQQRFPEFAHYFFVLQHFARYRSGGFNNVQPWWFFALVLALLALPWSAWTLAGLRREAAAPGALRTLPWIWLLAVLVFFSLPPSKLVGYILPATPPLALLAAGACVRRGTARAASLWRMSAALAVAVCLSAVALVAHLAPGSHQVLAAALRAGLAPGDRVVFLQAWYFDVPFAARLRQPVIVVDAWDDPATTARDNWRKELADAGRFAPAQAGALLRTPDLLAGRHCAPVALWVIGPAWLPARHALLRGAVRVAQQDDATLWRVPPVTPGSGCGRPSENSGDRS